MVVFLSALSTLSTFFLRGWAGKPRLVSAISTILGFAWANYRVFRNQETQISELRQANESREVKTPQLRIAPKAGSRYILHPVSNVTKGDFNAIWLEFHLMVENIGTRNSTVNDYQVEVVELHRTFRNLSPESRRAVQGRHCQHGLDPRSALSTTGVIKFDAESATNYGTLSFFILDVNIELFVANGLQMTGGERKFPPPAVPPDSDRHNPVIDDW